MLTCRRCKHVDVMHALFTGYCVERGCTCMSMDGLFDAAWEERAAAARGDDHSRRSNGPIDAPDAGDDAVRESTQATQDAQGADISTAHVDWCRDILCGGCEEVTDDEWDAEGRQA